MLALIKHLYSRTSFYSILLIFSHVISVSAAEKTPTTPLLTYTGNLRVLNIDIETLDAKEPIVEQLYSAIENDLKKRPEYKSENEFILGFLDQLQGRYKKAHDHFEKVEANHPLYATSLFYDGMTLRNMGLKESGDDQEKLCKSSMNAFEKVSELAPAYFTLRQPKEVMLSTFCYFNALVQKGPLNTQDEQWFQNTLKSSTSYVDQNKREALYFSYLDVIKSKETKAVQSYLDFGFTLFPKSARMTEEAKAINMQIPTGTAALTKEEVAKTEIEAQAMLSEAKEMIKKNDLKSGLQKLMSIIVKFPGSYTSETAKQDIVAMIKNEVKWKRQTTAFNDDLKKLPPDMLFSLAKYLWNQDYNMTAYSMYTTMVEKYSYHEKTPESYYSIARMHEDWSEWPKAIKFYSDLVEKYPRSEYFERAHFKVGFLMYMNQEYVKAIDWLAKEKALVTDPHQKAQATYWLGRTYEKMKKKGDASAQFDEVRKKYPLTYYSFILGIDPSSIKKASTPLPEIKIEQGHPLYLPKLYLAVGLHKPARQMIQSYGNQNDKNLMQVVQLFHDSGFHMFSMPNALSLSERRMEKNGLQEDLIKMIFPVKYFDVVEKESKASQTDPFIILSLIKQESGYFERAVSPANAVGLMQLLVPTAQTLAKKGKQPLPNKDDLFNPETNIQLGTSYINGLNEQFINDIVLVLSAYNAGPHRAVKWKNRWPNVRKDEFVELIPFSETRKYVKLILRNYSYYKFLVKNEKVNVSDFGF
jgi:TolA-binding protein